MAGKTAANPLLVLLCHRNAFFWIDGMGFCAILSL